MKDAFLIAVPLMASYWIAKKIGSLCHNAKKKGWVAVKPRRIHHRITYVSPVKGPRFFLLTVEAEYEFNGERRTERVNLWNDSYSSREAAEDSFRRLFENPEIYVNPNAPESIMK